MDLNRQHIKNESDLAEFKRNVAAILEMDQVKVLGKLIRDRSEIIKPFTIIKDTVVKSGYIFSRYVQNSLRSGH